MSKENENNILIIVAARLARRECLTRLHYLCDLEQRVLSTRNVRDAVEHAEEAITRESSKIVRGHDMLAKKLRDAESEVAALQEQVRALAAEKENARDVMLYAANNISYAIFNLSDKKLSDLKRGLSDTTCPTDSALLAERELRSFAARIRAGEKS